MIVSCRECAPGVGIVFTGADAFPFLLVSLSSLDEELDASDESSDESAFFFTSEARAAALASIFFEDTGTAAGFFSLIGSAFFEAFLLFLSVFAIADLSASQI